MKSRTAQLSAVVSAVVLAAITLVGCASEPQAAPASAPVSQPPSPRATPTAEDPDGCPGPLARIHFGTMRANISGNLTDQGPREFAMGTVGLDDDGDVVSYTVAPGDVPVAIGDRFCIDYAAGLPQLNHVRTIQPGQVLRLRVDPEVPWVPYFNPDDARPGFPQGPYQRAIEAMAAAGDANDVDGMRQIWTDTLSGMFTDQAVIDMIQQALDVGDPVMLNQMFS